MISTEVLVGWGITGAAIVGHVFIANYRIERNEREQNEYKKDVRKDFEDVWKWKDSHVREASEMREKYQNQLSELRGAQRVTDEKFNQILAALTEIKERLTALESHKND